MIDDEVWDYTVMYGASSFPTIFRVSSPKLCIQIARLL